MTERERYLLAAEEHWTEHVRLSVLVQTGQPDMVGMREHHLVMWRKYYRRAQEMTNGH